jgi:hypothetical protein
MEDVLLGCFYFKKTSSGNLIGEFTKQSLGYVSSESVDFISGNESSFIGTYQSTWGERGNAECGELTIKQVENTRKFSLIWVQPNGDTFEGEGFLVDGMLIGAYRNVK